MRRALIVAAAFAVAGCSIVNDPGRHRSATDSGQHMDAGMDAAADAGTDAEVDAGPAVASGEYCAQLAELACDAHERCCGAPDATFLATCVEDLTQSCTSLITDLLSTPEVGYDPQLAHEALETGRAMALACDLALSDWAIDRTGLFKPFRGSLEEAATCVLPGSEPNAASLIANFICADGRTCIDQGTPGWRCAALGTNPCRNYLDCPDGYLCNLSSMCQPRTANDGFCLEAIASACDSLVCRTSRCVPRTQDDVYCDGVRDL